MNHDPFSVAPPVSDYLARAAWWGSLNSIHYFLQRHMRLEQPSKGRTPLLWAISAGREDAMNLLLQKGADITKKTADGASALTCAVWSGQAKMVQLMMDKGFDPCERDNVGKTALDWAMAGGNAEIIKMLDAATRHNRTTARQERLIALAKQQRGPGRGFAP